jgi:transcriptional regulator GlxA family with amidase domain
VLQQGPAPLRALLVAVPETAGSALYGMIDVLAAAGNLWHQLVRGEPGIREIEPRIISPRRRPFSCGNGIPVRPDFSIAEAPDAEIIIVPELWLGPDEPLNGRHARTGKWLRDAYARGSSIYSACSGAILLADSGLLDGRSATSHWGYQRLFREHYPRVHFNPEPPLQFADPSGRIVTAGGTTSWHDLALHIIARHCSPGEAMRIAKVYLLKRHEEGQLPYDALVKDAPHADSVVRQCEGILKRIYKDAAPVGGVLKELQIAERTLKRRFKTATGLSLIDYVQNLRIEEAKRMLETTAVSVDEISAAVGYENASFFRRLFRRRCGVGPAAYRRMFAPASTGCTVGAPT